jgi:hypothetical protein
MSRESAVTEEIAYRIKECRVCGSEVGLGTDLPPDELVKPGYAIIIGEESVSISDEQAGNWSTEVEFAGSESDSNPPAVEGHILCVECAEAVHNHSPDKETYHGPLPDALISGTGTPELPISDKALAVIVLILVLLVLLLIL